MNHKNYSKEKAASMTQGLTRGGISSLLTTIIISAIVAWLVERGIIKEKQIGYCVMCQLALAAFFGAQTAIRKIQRRTLQVCIMSGAIYFAILLSITALFFGGQYSGVGETALMILCGCMLCAIWNNRRKTGRKQYGAINAHR